MATKLVNRTLQDSHHPHLMNHSDREALVFGYVKNMYDTNDRYIPSDLMSLFLRFYDNTIYWILEGADLDKFYKCNNHDYLQGPQFIIHDMLFENTLCPNGWRSDDKGFVIFFIETKKLPEHIKKMTVECTFYCQEINYFYKRSIAYEQRRACSNAWGASARAVALSKFMNNNEDKKYERLHFGCCVDVIEINFTNGPPPIPVHHVQRFALTSVPISNVSFIWRISPQLLHDFKSANIDQIFCSETFDNGDNWFLMCKPFGRIINNFRRHFIMDLRLGQLLSDTIKSVEVRYCVIVMGITSASEIFSFESDTRTEVFKMNSNWKHKELPIITFPTSLLSVLSSLSFQVTIEGINA